MTTKPIDLDYKKDVELFNVTAQAWAEAICDKRGKDCSVKSTQLRKFYDKVLELDSRVKQGEDFSDVLPFVKMLNSKVQYALSRKLINSAFEKMMNQCVSQVDSPEKLKNFKLFFEAVLGFYKGK